MAYYLLYSSQKQDSYFSILTTYFLLQPHSSPAPPLTSCLMDARSFCAIAILYVKFLKPNWGLLSYCRSTRSI